MKKAMTLAAAAALVVVMFFTNPGNSRTKDGLLGEMPMKLRLAATILPNAGVRARNYGLWTVAYVYADDVERPAAIGAFGAVKTIVDW